MRMDSGDAGTGIFSLDRTAEGWVGFCRGFRKFSLVDDLVMLTWASGQPR